MKPILTLFCMISACVLCVATQAGAAGIADRLSVTLPKGAGPFPAVIVMHTTKGPSAKEKTWARTLSKNGYAAIALTSFSEISGSRDALEAKVGPRITQLKQTYDWAAAQSWSSGQISVIGRSHGAWAVFDALQSGALRSKLYRAVAAAPRCDGARGKTRRMASRTPLLIVTGTKDQSYYAADCDALAGRIGGTVQAVSFKGGHHVDIESRAATKTILTFLK